jgi:uncharacterized repeat protein (TIGR01451 family)
LDNRYGVTLTGTTSTQNNLLLNNDIYGNTVANIDDTSGASRVNYLEYDNSAGEIRWKNANFLKDLSVDRLDSLIFGETINITHNLASVKDNFYTSGLNAEANVTLRNTPAAGMSHPVIARNIYALCSDITSPSCTHYTSLSAATVMFGVQEWSNYSISDANLSAVKINHTVYTASQNGTVIFEISVENVGDVNLTTTILDQLPPGITYLSATVQPTNVTGNSSVGQNLTWAGIGNLSNFRKGDTFIVNVTATVDDPLASECMHLWNNVTAMGAINSTSYATFNSNLPFTVCNASAQAIIINATAFVASQGGLVEYVVNVTNNGNVTLKDVFINSSLNTQLNYTSSSFTPVGSINSGLTSGDRWVAWHLENLTNGTTETFYINFTVDSPITGCVPTTNAISVLGVPFNGDNITAGASIPVTVCNASVEENNSLIINATSFVASQGGVVEYEVNVTNDGFVPLKFLYVNSSVDTQLSYDNSSIVNKSLMTGPNNGTAWVAWVLENVTNGTIEEFFINFTVDAPITGCVETINTVSVLGVPYNGDNVTAVYHINVTVCESNVTGIKVNMTQYKASQGGVLEYVINVTNTGLVNLSYVVVNDSYSGEVDHFNASLENNASGSDWVVWILPHLEIGATETIYFNITVNSTLDGCSYITNTVDVVGVPYNGDNVTDSNSTTAEVCNASVSALKVNMTAHVASQGGLVQYNISVTNNGDIGLFLIEVNDTLDSLLEFSDASPHLHSSANETLGHIYWAEGPAPEDIGDYILEPGETMYFYLNATVKSGLTGCQVTTNILNVTGTPYNGDPVYANYELNVTVCQASLASLKAHTNFVTRASQGWVVEYTLNVTNDGFVPLNVTITDTLPSELINPQANFTDNLTISGDVMTWAGIELDVNESKVITINATVGSLDHLECEYLNNSLVAVGVPLNGDDATTETYNDSVYVCRAGVQVTKSVSPSSIRRNSEATFTIKVENIGFVNLSNVNLTDRVLPAGLQLVSRSLAPNATVGGLHIWYLGNMSINDETEITITVRGVTTGTYTNTASAVANVPNGDDVTDDSEVVTLRVTAPSPSGGSSAPSGSHTGGLITLPPVEQPELPDPEDVDPDDPDAPKGEPEISSSTASPREGSSLEVAVKYPDGTPAQGIVTITAPDGTVRSMPLTDGSISFVPNMPGEWVFSYEDADGNEVRKSIMVAEKPAPPVEEEPTEAPVKPPAADDLSWLWIVLVVIGAIALLLLMGKRGKPSISKEK